MHMCGSLDWEFWQLVNYFFAPLFGQPVWQNYKLEERIEISPEKSTLWLCGTRCKYALRINFHMLNSDTKFGMALGKGDFQNQKMAVYLVVFLRARTALDIYLGNQACIFIHSIDLEQLTERTGSTLWNVEEFEANLCSVIAHESRTDPQICLQSRSQPVKQQSKAIHLTENKIDVDTRGKTRKARGTFSRIRANHCMIVRLNRRSNLSFLLSECNSVKLCFKNFHMSGDGSGPQDGVSTATCRSRSSKPNKIP